MTLTGVDVDVEELERLLTLPPASCEARVLDQAGSARRCEERATWRGLSKCQRCGKAYCDLMCGEHKRGVDAGEFTRTCSGCRRRLPIVGVLWTPL